MSDPQTLLDALAHDGDLATARLDHWAATSPDAVFVHYREDGTNLTYAEARRVTDAIAGNLAAHGITRGARISVFSADPAGPPSATAARRIGVSAYRRIGGDRALGWPRPRSRPFLRSYWTTS